MASTQQTPQSNVVQVAFEEGMTAVYAAASGSVLQFDFDTDTVLFDQQGADLVITNANGDSVVIDDYIALAEAGTPPQVILEDGITVAGDVFLFSVGHEQTAADAAVSGGGMNEFFADPGALLGGAEGALGQGSDGPDAGGMAHHGFGYDSHDDFSSPAAQGDVGYSYPDIAENTETYQSGPIYAIGHNRTFFPTQSFIAPVDDPDDYAVRAADADSHLGGGAGNDFLTGGSGNDILVGNAGHDIIAGNGGDDHIYGGSGNDMLEGNDGADYIYGGGGYDTITLGAGEDVLVFNSDTFQDGSAIVEVNDFTLGEDGIKLEDGVTFEALRDYGTYTEAVLSNGTDDNVIVRLLGDSKADFDTHIDSLGAGYDYSASDTDQLVQYMAGNEGAWV